MGSFHPLRDRSFSRVQVTRTQSPRFRDTLDPTQRKDPSQRLRHLSSPDLSYTEFQDGPKVKDPKVRHGEPPGFPTTLPLEHYTETRVSLPRRSERE